MAWKIILAIALVPVVYIIIAATLLMFCSVSRG